MKNKLIIFLMAYSFFYSNIGLADCVDKNHYYINNDEAFDVTTHLTWKRCSYGQHFSSDGICEGAAVKMSYQQAKEVVRTMQGYWRLPTKTELKSLVDVSCGVPSIHPVFSNTVSDWYWADGFPRNEDIGFISFETGVLAWGLNEHFEFNLRLVKAD